MASLSEKIISPRAKCLEGSNPFIAWGTMLDNLKTEKNDKRYTELKFSGNSKFLAVKTMSCNIRSENTVLDLTERGLLIFMYTDKHLDFLIPEGLSRKIIYNEHSSDSSSIIRNVICK